MTCDSCYPKSHRFPKEAFVCVGCGIFYNSKPIKRNCCSCGYTTFPLPPKQSHCSGCGKTYLDVVATIEEKPKDGFWEDRQGTTGMP